jgi:hypothetical protein
VIQHLFVSEQAFRSSHRDITVKYRILFSLVEATCKARGDPHYTTFDGTRFDFMGKCEYVLAKDVVNNTFEIRQANEPCFSGLPTCTKSLTVIFPGVTIELRRGMTLVNGGEVTLPVFEEGKKYRNEGTILYKRILSFFIFLFFS